MIIFFCTAERSLTSSTGAAILTTTRSVSFALLRDHSARALDPLVSSARSRVGLTDGDVTISRVIHVPTLSSWLLCRPLGLLHILAILILLLLQLHSPVLVLENSLVQVRFRILILVASVSGLVVVHLDVVILASVHLLRAFSSR